MPYKLDGAKFPTLEDLLEALYPLYADKMSEEEFKKYAEENAEKCLQDPITHARAFESMPIGSFHKGDLVHF